MDYLKAFIVGGLICVVGQILIDKTKLTPARILVTFVVLGVFLQLIRVYQPLVDFAGAGATVPLTGFGYNLCKGAAKAVDEQGFLGIFTGGFTSSAGGIAAALIFGFLVSVIFRSKPKK
ncbi:MAG: stage V sporulation protein AE [Oscillospiraceae bacterium]|nr:stage V sporulation protein AE [Oscillospiraceae bacterium]